MSAGEQQRSRRQRGKALPLPAFTFPAAPPVTTQERDEASQLNHSPLLPSSIIDLFPTVTPTSSSSSSQPAPPSPTQRRHRRSQAVSTHRPLHSRRSNSKHYGMYVPPVPEIPFMYRQLSGRSTSDVSSCPTLETDESGPLTPEPFTPSAYSECSPFDDYFGPVSFTTFEQKDERQQAEDHHTRLYESDEENQDDDDDDEFWHCRGIDESGVSTRKPSLVDDETGAGVDVHEWAKSIEPCAGASWLETASVDDDYMQLMRHPLLA